MQKLVGIPPGRGVLGQGRPVGSSTLDIQPEARLLALPASWGLSSCSDGKVFLLGANSESALSPGSGLPLAQVEHRFHTDVQGLEGRPLAQNQG